MWEDSNPEHSNHNIRLNLPATPLLNIKVDNEDFKIVSKIKYLGVIIDNTYHGIAI